MHSLYVILCWLSQVIHGEGCSNLIHVKVLASARRFSLGVACVMRVEGKSVLGL